MAGNIKGITVEIGANTSKLSSALRSLNTQTGKLKSEMKQVDAALKMNPGNIDLVRQKQELLSSSVQETENKLKEMKDALKKASESGANEKNSAGFRRLQREIEKTEQDLKTLTAESRRFNTFSANVMAAAGKVSSLGTKLKSAGRSMRTLTASFSIVGGIAASVGVEFDSSMSKVQAVSGATGAQFEQLRDKAREMGAKTKFSASEAAEAMNYMAMAGWKTNQMLEGIEGVMNLAAASGEDLATTSDIVTDALTALGYSAADSGRLADVMAAASSNANTNVSMMGETFKYAAAVAGAMNYSMEDLALATGLMANSGIKATQAGTSLRSIISRMAAPTGAVASTLDALNVSIKDANGKARPFRDVLIDLRSAMSGMSETEKTAVASTIAGKNAMSGFLALINGTDKDFEKLTNAIDNSSGAAEDMANTMLDNFGGQLTILKSSLQELAIAVSDTVTPMLKTLTSAVQGIVSWFNGLSDSTKRIVVQMAMFTAAIGPVLTILGTMMEKTTVLVSGLGSLAGKLNGAAGFMGALTSATGASALAIGGFAAALGVGVAASAIAIQQTNEITRANDDFIASTKKAVKETETQNAQAQIYADKIEELAEKENKSSAEKKVLASYVEKLNELMPNLNLQYDEESDKLNQTSSAINKKIAMLKAQAVAQAYATQAQQVANRIATQTMQLEQKRDQYNANKQKLQNLDPESSKAQKIAADNAKLMNEMNQLTGAIDKNEKKLTQYQTRANTFTAFQTLEEKAKKAGVKIPEDLATAMKNGETIIPDTVEELNNLIKFNKAVKSAGLSGKKIPENLQKGIASGKIKVPKTVTGLNNLIKFSKAIQNAKDAGIKIPKWLAKGLKSKKLSTAQAAKLINDQVKFEAALKAAKKKGIEIPNGLAKGVRSGKIKASNATAVLNKAIKSKAKEVTLASTGTNITLGLASGIRSGKGSAVAAMNEVVAAVKKAASKASGEGSPCRKFMPTGKNISRGLAEGMIQGISSVETAGRKVIASAKDSMTVPSVSKSKTASRSITKIDSGTSNVYNIGDITIDASKVDSASTIDDIVRIFTQAKSFA